MGCPGFGLRQFMSRLVGTVVGTAAENIIKVSVERILKHPKYTKVDTKHHIGPLTFM